jgi:PAS domain S-box-containing protein
LIERIWQLETEVKRQNVILTSLHETTLGLIGRLDVMELLKSIVKRAAELAGSPNAYIYLLDDKKDTLDMYVSIGYYVENQIYNLKKGEGLGGRVLVAREPLLIDNYANWEGRLQEARWDTAGSIMGIPFRSGDKVVGALVICIFDDDSRKFTKDEMFQLSRFAELASVAFDNAKLYTAVRQELSERIKAEEALHESAERLRAVFECAKDCIYVKDRDLKYQDGNQMTAELVGVPLESFLGLSDCQLFPEDLARHTRQVDLRVLDGETVEEEITVLKNGQARVFHSIKAPLKDKQGNVAGICGIARNITERKKAEADMFEAKEAIARAERLASLGTMAAGISHEINQPLNSIKMTASSIWYWYNQSTARNLQETMEDILEISRQADRIANIIRHMRSFVPNRRHGPSAEIVPCNINNAVEQALSLVGNQISSHGIRLRTELNPLCINVMATMTGLEEIVINLLINAMEALDTVTDGKKEILVATFSNKCAGLEVSDTGPGIKEEIRERIFDPFFTTKLFERNMGMGLSIVYSKVTSFGGRIQVTATGNKGTTFLVEFPKGGDTQP